VGRPSDEPPDVFPSSVQSSCPLIEATDDNLEVVRNCMLIALSLIAALGAQDASALAEARAMDKEIQRLPNIPEAKRDAAFQEMLHRIRNEPKPYRLALASNLAVSAGEVATESATLQETADLLVDELQGSPESGADLALTSLAEFAFYRHIQVSLDAPLYRAKLAKLDDQARTRANADFTLTDMRGKSWHLKGLGGKVVLLNFWATWCPPCQREMADFQAMYNRFAAEGLLILAVTGEDLSTVKRYLAERPVTFSVLLDPSDVTKKQFLVEGLPHSVLYNREGKMVAQIPGPLTKQQLLNTLSQAGLR
jgi:peroxiredoxin